MAYLVFGCSPSAIAGVTAIAVIASIASVTAIAVVTCVASTVVVSAVSAAIGTTIDTSVNSRTTDNSTNGTSSVVAQEINVAVSVVRSRSGRAGMGVGDVVTTEVISLIAGMLGVLRDLVTWVLVDGLPDGGVVVANGKGSVLGVDVVDFF